MRALLLSTLAAVVVTLVLGVVLSMFIPVMVSHPECSLPGAAQVQKKDRYTLEEIERAEADAKKRVECEMQKDRELSGGNFWLLTREGGKWLTWLPWVAVPFLSRLRRYPSAAWPVALLAALVLLRVILPLEALLSSLALLVGVAVVRGRAANVANDVQPYG